MENRTEFKNNNRIWYGLHRAREKNIFMAEKLVAPQRNRTNKFAYNNSLFFASADVYFITKHPKYNFAPYYLLGILNSKLIYTWLYYRGKRKGDMLELYFTPLSGIPIKVGSSEEQRKLNTLVRKIVEDNSILDSEKDKIERVINEIVFDIYGLSADDRKAINEFYASKH